MRQAEAIPSLVRPCMHPSVRDVAVRRRCGYLSNRFNARVRSISFAPTTLRFPRSSCCCQPSKMTLSHPLLPDGVHPGSPKWAKVGIMSSYALAAWAWRSWEFAVALLLITLYPDSLMMVSAYGIADNIVRVLMGSAIGSYIRRLQIAPAATSMYLLQNTCIAVSAACALALLLPDVVQLTEQQHWVLQWVMIVVGAFSSVGSAGVRITVEVEAVTALAGGRPATLSMLNAGFRAIDLTCLLLAPLSVGAVLTFLGPTWGTVLLSGYTMVAWIPEILLLRMAINNSPSLRNFKSPLAQEASLHSDTEDPEEPGSPSLYLGPPPDPTLDTSLEGEAVAGAVVRDGADAAPTNGHQGQEGEEESSVAGSQQSVAHRSALWVYLTHPVLLPNLALALLYCTVLSLGFLMTGYLQWTGLTSAEVAAFRGIGAVTALLATALFPWLRKTMGLVAAGQLGIMYQLVCLAMGVAPVALAVLGQGGSPGQLQPAQDLVRMLVGGVVASRTGLWVFDLAVTQLIQERVPPEDMSVVCGVQSSLQACCEMLSFLAGVYLSDPAYFYWLMLGSLGVVALAALLYTSFSFGQACCRGAH